MINLLSATPGSGKSLLATEILLNLSRDNISNLKHNYYYAKAFFEKLAELKIEDYLNQLLVTHGQGLERVSEIIFFESDFFDFLKTEYYINVISNPDTDDIVNNFPPYYFERIVLLNLIIKNINVNEKTKFQDFKPVRTIYTNIADLKLVQCRPLPSECDWRKTPQGSYFAIDEAQLIPIFSDEAKGIDPIVKELTIHRHKGYDFLFITQEPSFVHKYIRKLASLHIHLVNIFGWEQSMRMEWSVVQDSPNAIKSIARAENLSRWRFPTHVYNLYKSTTINTRVKRMPKKLVIFAVSAILCAIVACFLLFHSGNNPLFKVLTGKPLDQHVQQKPSENNLSKILPVKTNLPASSPVESKTQDQDLTIICRKAENLDKKECVDWYNNLTKNHSSVSTVSNGSQMQSVSYDVSKPYDQDAMQKQASSSYEIRNKPIFSGCFVRHGKYVALTEQGTIIKGVSQESCKRLIKDPLDRPYDYFTDRTPRPVPSTTEQKPSDDKDKVIPLDKRVNVVESHPYFPEKDITEPTKL